MSCRFCEPPKPCEICGRAMPTLRELTHAANSTATLRPNDAVIVSMPTRRATSPAHVVSYRALGRTARIVTMFADNGEFMHVKRGTVITIRRGVRAWHALTLEWKCTALRVRLLGQSMSTM